ncbi:sugar kinase [Arachnia propionica]|uniref:Sugar kinase n=1 Tax=Arachnia propionica TaxID=1750 RepID=A0A3P1T5P8_9ACTN|nr:sugar kinase [Arachnia propionica]RRD04699.1 sugar kinase [Arachnia propionica]
MTVLTVGEAMGLVTPTTATPLSEATQFRLETAGAEANLAVHLARSGHAVAWASLLGCDPVAERILRTLGSNGVDVSLVRRVPGARTGIFLKDPGPGRTTVHYYRDGSAASGMDAAFADVLPLPPETLVHLTGITPALGPSCHAMVERLVERVRSLPGVELSFDVNHRAALWPGGGAAEVLGELVRRADVVFVGRDEAAAVWGTGSAETVRERFPTVPELVVKDAGVGATAFTAGGCCVVPAPPVEVVDPVGAGDAFAAGYLAARLEGDGVTKRLERGHALAATVLRRTGDI